MGSFVNGKLKTWGCSCDCFWLKVAKRAFVSSIAWSFSRRGSLLSTSIFVYAATAPVNGYFSGSLYARMGGRHMFVDPWDGRPVQSKRITGLECSICHATLVPLCHVTICCVFAGKVWIRQMFMSAFLVPALVCAVAFLINFIAIYYHASRAIPFGTMVWCKICLPSIVIPYWRGVGALQYIAYRRGVLPAWGCTVHPFYLGGVLFWVLLSGKGYRYKPSFWTAPTQSICEGCMENVMIPFVIPAEAHPKMWQISGIMRDKGESVDLHTVCTFKPCTALVPVLFFVCMTIWKGLSSKSGGRWGSADPSFTPPPIHCMVSCLSSPQGAVN